VLSPRGAPSSDPRDPQGYLWLSLDRLAASRRTLTMAPAMPSTSRACVISILDVGRQLFQLDHA
jgi:hypothetical protein